MVTDDASLRHEFRVSTGSRPIKHPPIIGHFAYILRHNITFPAEIRNTCLSEASSGGGARDSMLPGHSQANYLANQVQRKSRNSMQPRQGVLFNWYGVNVCGVNLLKTKLFNTNFVIFLIYKVVEQLIQGVQPWNFIASSKMLNVTWITKLVIEIIRITWIKIDNLLLLFCPNVYRPGPRPGQLLLHQFIWPGMAWCSAVTGIVGSSLISFRSGLSSHKFDMIPTELLGILEDSYHMSFTALYFYISHRINEFKRINTYFETSSQLKVCKNEDNLVVPNCTP